jgi:hypothetical protein
MRQWRKVKDFSIDIRLHYTEEAVKKKKVVPFLKLKKKRCAGEVGVENAMGRLCIYLL